MGVGSSSDRRLGSKARSLASGDDVRHIEDEDWKMTMVQESLLGMVRVKAGQLH